MSVKLTRHILHGLTQENLSLLFCRAMTYFLIQGAIVELTYAFGGPGIGPDSFLTGFRLDPIHAVVHFGLGVAGTYVGFFRPSRAVLFTRFFAVFYLTLAFFGTFTAIHFGMRLGLFENGLHWSLGALAAMIGFLPIFPRNEVTQIQA
jgi:Domain of unknown function (DUF4383)